ncbi:exodeoxyribonuclease V subunit beta [Colwellia sp. C1TZA3]|uniref:exodeoxyribonuclease V subunit beta n=1 Tax=Colwellia sp. C1TZA3 TaxID=2508879 RepID=UPI0011B9BD5A|nr:exodeoxyribonuclease V subunit beta [Colwellia sp. C1TZA3]TWX72928.1 exodeoxyribonuclease V subunit beta [Colwellia sp. C1TZA3]
MKNLNANTIELQGKHLIEASAGTGKTHNITRIFLRLLLERELPIEQILVMTFTKDATEEIRGRIDDFIRESLHSWDNLIIHDNYFKALNQNLVNKNISSREVKARLSQALLYIDEAAIFTIHGFCKRVLNQYAFASGISFNAQMETNTQDITLEACQDWYRVLALGSENNSQAFKLVTEFWPEPGSFINQFSKALATQNVLNVQDPENISVEFKGLVEQAIASLETNIAMLTTALIEVKKGVEQEKRHQELTLLLNWLAELSADVAGKHGKIPDAFIDGRRYARSKVKNELIEIFTAVNSVKKQHPDLAKQINRAQALLVVRKGIYHIRAEITRKKLQANVMGFDDLISTLNDCLTHQSGQEPDQVLANSIFTQFPVALVDEFQDTDPQQFSILKAIYYHQPSAALYMIGDPKQAIYGFRGGDIFAYLSARNDCDYQWLMDTNWRSSASMITGYNRLFYGNKLSGEAVDVFGYQIPYLPVKASAKAHEKVFLDSEFNALQFIHFNVEADAKSKDGKEKAVKQSYRAQMSAWCANEIVRLLACPKLNMASGDIALLVRDGTEAADIKFALNQCGLSSVFMSNRANLLQSDETKHLLQLLKGILFLENDRLYTAALASPLMGFNREKLLQLQHDEQQWQALKISFEKLRNEWQFKGFISMALQLMHQHFQIDVSNADNSLDDKHNADRILTNLLHLFELLQGASQRHRQPQELLFWFEQQSQIDNPEVEAELRLESDENLIRIITQHGSKGMEYPVVFVPFATRHKDPLKFGNRHVSFIEFHDENGVLQQSLDGNNEARAGMAAEAYAEAIRLLYVAVTRAEKRCYILSTAFDHYENSPLGKTLKWSADTDIATSLQQLAQDNPDEIALDVLENYLTEETLSAAGLAKPTSVTANIQSTTDEINVNAESQAEVARFNGKIERDWWLSSFSALSKNLRHNGVSSPDRDNQETEPTDQQDNNYSTLSNNINELRFTLTKGAQTGNLLHDILEQTDFSAPDWQKSCHWPLVKYGAIDGVIENAPESGVESGVKSEVESEVKSSTASSESTQQNHGQTRLIKWLEEVLQTPLSANNSLSLAQLELQDTLRETEFYYPMRSASSSQLTKLLTEHRNNNTSRKIAKKHRVHLPSYHQLKGMMHGFIDLIFQAEGKYYVCDYKSSHLGDQYSDYNDAAMRHNIEKNHYDLQYLIYALALHRHLKYALADYDPKQHFGGIYYLYLRGMSNQTQHQDCGVYYRKITLAELDQLDDIFAGETTNA